jgi:hypothetical protein
MRPRRRPAGEIGPSVRTRRAFTIGATQETPREASPPSCGAPDAQVRSSIGRREAERNSLADKLTVEAKALADLKIEKAAVAGERRTVEADLGPVRYLATLMGQPDEVVLRWFILVVALLLDPAAVLLLLAATRTPS